MARAKGSGVEQQELFRELPSADLSTALLHERSRLLAKAAHEIYNSSTSLVANLTTLRGDVIAEELDPDLAVEILDECLEGMGRMTDVLRRLREISRERRSLVLQKIDLGDAVSQVCKRLSKRRGLELITELELVKVQGSLDVLVSVIEHMVEVWLSRLPGLEASVGLGLVIRVEAKEGTGRLELRDLTNTEDSLPKGLFSAFQKGDRDEMGTRLFVCRSFAEDMGGSLEARMEAGLAVLCLKLPIA